MKILIFYNPYKFSEINKVKSSLKEKKIEIVKCIPAGSNVSPDDIEESDIFLVLGGDGTVLRVSELAVAHSKPLLGINVGTLGFLTAYNFKEFDKAIDDLLNNRLNIEKRNLLEAYIGGKKYFFINDLVIQRAEPIGTIDVSVKVNKTSSFIFTGDGIIISTSTGSTGYALSAGGPIIDPDLKIMEIIPLAPHTLGIRPLIISSDKKIELKLLRADSGFAYILVDGDLVHRITEDSTVLISGSEFSLQLVRRKEISFFDVLVDKLYFARRKISVERNKYK